MPVELGQWLDQHTWIALTIVIACAVVILAAVFWPEPKYKPRIWRLSNGLYTCASEDGVIGVGRSPEAAYLRWQEQE